MIDTPLNGWARTLSRTALVPLRPAHPVPFADETLAGIGPRILSFGAAVLK